MGAGIEEDWHLDLGQWPEPHRQDLGNTTRRRRCPVHIAGLMGPGDRKRTQPLAVRAEALSYGRTWKTERSACA